MTENRRWQREERAAAEDNEKGFGTMEQTGRLQGVREARPADLTGGGGHPNLDHFDRIRSILLASGLAADPETYELLYLHVSGADAALSNAVERALAAGKLTPETIRELRRNHLGDIAAAEVLALVEAAQETANRLASRLNQTYADLKTYDATISAGDEALSMLQSAHELAQLVQRLRRANATMMASNRRLEADIQVAVLETGRLLDRLEAAERTARTDPLTGLLNRRGLMDALKRAQNEAVTTETPLAVAIVDIDHFKRVNDQWGHSIGDEVLRCVGSHLQTDARKAAGKDAFVGRYGGEEFLVALPATALPQATSILDNLRARLARLVLKRAADDANLGRVTFSAGVAQLRADDTLDSLVDRADSALYNAKRFGRDRVLPERAANAR